jgi:hypothetical protein
MKKILFYVSILLVGLSSCSKSNDELVVNNQSATTNRQLARNVTYVHPGTVLTAEQLSYAKAKISAGLEPWTTTYANFIADNSAFLSSTYTSHAHTTVGRGLYKSDYENDSKAMFANAVMWHMTGSARYADKVVELLDSWAATCTSIQYPDNDWELCTGYGLHFMIYGADIIYNYSGFTATKKANAVALFTRFYNYYQAYATTYSVKCPFVIYGWPSWGSSAGKFIMAYGIFCNNSTAYQLAISYFNRTAASGADVGTIQTAFLASGQPLECARDQYYSQLGMTSFLEMAQMARNQGDNSLFDARSGVLGKAMEYIAKYNLGNNVTWASWTPATPIWQVTFPINSISASNRGRYRNIWYLSYNYYQRYRGLNVTNYAAQVIGNRPYEGQAETITDEVGYGSLFYCNTDQTVVAPSYTWSGVY